MTIVHKIRMQLRLRGFRHETLLNNRGLIDAVIDETILITSKAFIGEKDERIDGGTSYKTLGKQN